MTQYPYTPYPPNPLPVPVSPAKALKSYLLGRWMLFALLSSLPALILAPYGQITGSIGLALLLAPGYFAFRGASEIRKRSEQLEGDTTFIPLVASIAVIVATCLVEFISSMTVAFIPYLGSIVFSGITICAIRYLETAAKVNHAAVDKKTRLAATVSAVITGTLALLFISSGLILMIAIPFAMLFLFFLAGEPEVTFTLLFALPIITGIIALVFGLKGRRSRLTSRQENPSAPNPVLHLKETVLYSLAGSSLFIAVALGGILIFASSTTSKMMESF